MVELRFVKSRSSENRFFFVQKLIFACFNLFQFRVIEICRLLENFNSFMVKNFFTIFEDSCTRRDDSFVVVFLRAFLSNCAASATNFSRVISTKK